MSLFLVTGGAGFIGSNIVERLLQQGKSVRVLDNFSTGKRQNLDPFIDQIDFIEGDIRSYHILRNAVEGVDYILHQAALPSVPRSINDPITTHEVNVSGTLNVLEAAKEAGVKRVVYASSSSIYGNSPTLPKVETMSPNPLSPYAVSKLSGEKYCQVFHRIYGLETVALRYFNVFGPRQDPTSQYSAVIPKFITAIENGKSPTIFGDGKQSRDFTFVQNVIDANLAACEKPNVGGEVINIACGEAYSLIQLVEQLGIYSQKQVEPKFLKDRQGDVKHSLAQIEKAGQLLGYQPKHTFHEGLKQTYQYYCDK